MLVTIWTVGQYRVLICSPRFFRFTGYEAVKCFGRVRPQRGPCRLPKASAFGVSCFLCKTTDQVKKIPGPSIFLNLDSSSTHTFTPNSPFRNLGEIFDQSLSVSDHTTQLSRSCLLYCMSATFAESVPIGPTCSILKLHRFTIATYIGLVHAKLDY